MAQIALPVSDVSIGSWTGVPVNSAGNRYQNIDEASPADTDYVTSPDNPNGAGAEFGLGALTDPLSSASHVVSYRYVKTVAGVPGTGGSNVNLSVTLRQGGTDIASNSHSSIGGPSWVAGSFTLSAAQADAITDYSNLRLFFSATGGGGSPSNRRGAGVSWAQLSVPDAAGYDGEWTMTMVGGEADGITFTRIAGLGDPNGWTCSAGYPPDLTSYVVTDIDAVSHVLTMGVL